MRRALSVAWLVLLASCGPDYGHTAFRCKGDDGCPASQTCFAGRCRRGVPSGVEIVCGAEMCHETQQCCRYDFGAPRCIAAGDVCPDTSALCDGREDCQGNDRCCADGDILFCDETCKDYACRVETDCPSTAPNCCGVTAGTWGECSEFPC